MRQRRDAVAEQPEGVTDVVQTFLADPSTHSSRTWQAQFRMKGECLVLHGVLFRRCSTPSKYVPQLRPLPINLSLHSSALVAGPMPDMAALTSLCFHCWAWSCMSLATALVHYSAGPPLSCLHPPAWQTQPVHQLQCAPASCAVGPLSGSGPGRPR